jgi:alpha-L-rhamnosidase
MQQKNSIKLSRRAFLGFVSTAGALTLLPNSTSLGVEFSPKTLKTNQHLKFKTYSFSKRKELDLTPASWIWYPAERILANSFFHFRRTLNLDKPVKSAKGWILGESRYLLFLNGERIQFGPAPNDPRYAEADPVDFSDKLQQGENVIGATVVYFGFGDGAWPGGKAGFIFNLELLYEDGEKEIIVSDSQWSVQQAKSWPAGQYKRWYLRALQEEFDNRVYPLDWNDKGFKEDQSWLKATVFSGDSNKTALSSSISDYLFDSGGNQLTQLRRRSIPMILEKPGGLFRLREVHYLHWNIPVREFFDFKTVNAFAPGTILKNFNQDSGSWTFEVPEEKDSGLVLSFEIKEQVIGWPFFTINCQKDTVVELMVQQGHQLLADGGPGLINNNFNSWTRFICREGENQLMTFDYESIKWIQLHVHNTSNKLIISNVGVKRRVYDFPFKPSVVSSHPGFNKLLNACVNTVMNNSHDTIVDCVGRERQQYSGDIGHIIHALHYGFGESRLPARFVDTYSQGLTLDGYFMDSWPAYDRLNRISQRQLGLTPWGILLDHSVGFCYDCWYHYLYSDRKEDLEEAYPRLLQFYELIKKSIAADGLLPVVDLGVNAIWMDTDSYKNGRDKQCAYNLYVASMLKLALAPLSSAFGDKEQEIEMLSLSQHLSTHVEKKFWSSGDNLLIINLPWAEEDGEMRTCERSLAHWVLGGFAPDLAKGAIIQELKSKPNRLGRCYPANVVWLYWTLAALGETQEIVKDFNQRWINMLSVKENNTIQENWVSKKDSQSQFSHSGIAPFFAAYMCFAGIEVLEPGAKLVRVKPQMADLEKLELTYHTGIGPLKFYAEGIKGKRKLSLDIPDGMTVHLDVPAQGKGPQGIEQIANKNNFKTYKLVGGKDYELPDLI